MHRGLPSRPRNLASPFLLLAFCGALVAACGDLGLSSPTNSADVPASGPEGGGGAVATNAQDASGTGDGSPGVLAPADSATGSAPANPLCNLSIQNEGGLPCNPDVPASPSGQACQVPPGYADAGAASDAGGGASLSDASPELACHVVVTSGARTQACALAGTGRDGDSCQSGADCAPAFECVGTLGQCRHYCCGGDTSCTSGFCDIQSTRDTNVAVPVCAPVSPCKLLTWNACATGQTCAIVKDDGTTSCVAVGTAKAGDACDWVHCGAGLTCLGKSGARLCYTLCHLNEPGDCPGAMKCKGSAELFSDPDYGICQ
jgi:hypothetical protein